jgi:NAD dependent epimerase/dehydratase family enzyme
MNILITGGLGFVGTQLSLRFPGRGERATVVNHLPQPRPYTPKEVNYVAADTAVPGAWREEIQGQHAVINLAGTSIFTRWSEKTKQLIHDSRILNDAERG